MLKKLFTLISLLWACQHSYAQNHDTFWKQFQKLYNNDQFAAIYDLLAPSFKAEMSLEQNTAFFKEGIKKNAGKMNSVSLLKEDEAGNTYLITCTKIQLEVLLILDKDEKVAGWMWQPYKAAQATEAINIQYSNPLKNKVDSTLDREARKYLQQNPAARLSFAIVSPEQTDYYFYAADMLPDQQNVYELGSITKTYIGWLIAQAVTEAKLDIETDVRKYLKGDYKNLEREGQAILIKHLLNHSSGLPRLPENYMSLIKDPENPYKSYSNEELLKSLHNTKLKTKPGTKSDYSNYGYGLLGYILEQVYQQPLEQLLNLKLNTVLKLDTITFKQNPLLLRGHNEQQAEVANWEFQAMAGAGAIKTTIKSTADFLRQQILAQDKAIQLSHTIIDKNMQPQTAYAWQVNALKNQSDTLIWHNGMTGGFSSFYGFFKQQKTGLVMLSNVAQSTDAFASGILKVIYQQQ